LVPDQVIVEVSLAMTPALIAALEQRHNLAHLDQLASQLTGTNLVLARIQDQRTVAAVILALETDAQVMAAQPNYLFTLQQIEAARRSGDAAPQYALAKLRLPEAHQLAKGGNVLVAMIDSGVDSSHPELTGAIADSYDLLQGSRAPHSHGTAIAGLIGAHSKLLGAAPAARILTVRAFDSDSANPQGVTFNILKGLDWSAVKGARVINMSFAGPSDPAIHRSLDSANKNGIVLIAAAGNAGAKSPPLFPAADAAVIAVTATDADDKFYAASNRGRHIAVAAPGVDLLVAAPGGRYQILSGTSLSAAEVSGIAALIIERKPDLRPDAVRTTLLSTGKALAPERSGTPLSARLVDAYRAISTGRVLPVAAR
jgi:subtilisin family serine protease